MQQVGGQLTVFIAKNAVDKQFIIAVSEISTRFINLLRIRICNRGLEAPMIAQNAFIGNLSAGVFKLVGIDNHAVVIVNFLGKDSVADIQMIQRNL